MYALTFVTFIFDIQDITPFSTGNKPPSHRLTASDETRLAEVTITKQKRKGVLTIKLFGCNCN